MLINEGKYKARVVRAVLTEAGQDKKPVIEITAELTGGDVAEPVQLSKTFWLGEEIDTYDEDKRAEWVVSIEKLRKIGFDGDDITQLDSCIGFVGVAGVKNKPNKNGGGSHSTISWIGPEMGAKPMDASKAKSFAEQMKARIRAVEGGNRPAPNNRPTPIARPAPTRTQPQSRPAPQESFTAPDDGEIPF